MADKKFSSKESFRNLQNELKKSFQETIKEAAIEAFEDVELEGEVDGKKVKVKGSSIKNEVQKQLTKNLEKVTVSPEVTIDPDVKIESGAEKKIQATIKNLAKNAKIKPEVDLSKTISSYEELKSVMSELEDIYNKLQRPTHEKRYNKYDEFGKTTYRDLISDDDFRTSQGWGDAENIDKTLESEKKKLLEIYKLYKNIQSAIKNHNGWYKDQKFEEDDLEQIAIVFKTYAQSYHELVTEYNDAAKRMSGGMEELGMEPKTYEDLESVTSKMTKNFKGYVKEVIEDSAAVKENNKLYEEEVQQIQIANKALNERYNLLRKNVVALAKSKGDDVRSRVIDIIPFINDDWDYEEYDNMQKWGAESIFGGETIDVLQEVAKALGIEIPQAADKARESIEQVITAGGDKDTSATATVEAESGAIEQLKQKYFELIKVKEKLNDLSVNPDDVYYLGAASPSMETLEKNGFVNLIKEYYDEDQADAILEELEKDTKRFSRIEKTYYDEASAQDFLDKFKEKSFDEQLAMFDKIAKKTKRVAKETRKNFEQISKMKYLESGDIEFVLDDGTKQKASSIMDLGDTFGLYEQIRDKIKSINIVDTWNDSTREQLDSMMENFYSSIMQALDPITEKIHNKIQEAFALDDHMLSTYNEVLNEYDKWEPFEDEDRYSSVVIANREKIQQGLEEAFKGAMPQELIEEYNKIWESIDHDEVFPNLEQAIERVNTKASELGYTYDASSKIWVKAAQQEVEATEQVEKVQQKLNLEDLSRDALIKWIQDLKKATVYYDRFQSKIANDEPYDEAAFSKAEQKYKEFFEVLQQYKTLIVTLKDGTTYSLIDDLEAEDWDTTKSHFKSFVIEKKEESQARQENTAAIREEMTALEAEQKYTSQKKGMKLSYNPDEQTKETQIYKDNLVTVDETVNKIGADAEVTCKKAETAVKKFFDTLGDQFPDLIGWKDSILEAISNGVFSQNEWKDGGWAWDVEPRMDYLGDLRGYYVSIVQAKEKVFDATRQEEQVQNEVQAESRETATTIEAETEAHKKNELAIRQEAAARKVSEQSSTNASETATEIEKEAIAAEKTAPAFEKATKAKSKFTKANKQTETQTSASTAVITEEAAAAAKASDEIKTLADVVAGYIRNQKGDASTGNFSYTEAISEVADMQRVVKDGVVVSEELRVNYDKLTKKLIDADTEIVVLTHRVAEAHDEERERLQQNLDILKNQRAIYQNLYDFMEADGHYAITEEQQASFRAQRDSNRQLIENEQVARAIVKHRQEEERVINETLKLESAVTKERNRQALFEIDKQNKLFSLDSYMSELRSLGLLTSEVEDQINNLGESLVNASKSFDMQSFNKQFQGLKNSMAEGVKAAKASNTTSKNPEISKNLTRQYALYRKIYDIDKQIINIDETKEGSDVKINGLLESRKSLVDEYIDLYTELNQLGADAQIYSERQNKLLEIRADKLREINQAEAKNQGDIIGDIANKSSELTKKIINGKSTDDFKKELLDARKLVDDLATRASSMDLSQLRQEWASVGEEVEKVLSKVSLAEYRKAAQSSLEKLRKSIEDIEARNTAMGASFRAEFDNLKLKVDTSESVDDVEKLKAEIVKLEGRLIAAGKTGKSAFQQFGEAVRTSTRQFLAQYFSLQDFVRYAREGFQAVVDVDTALTELRKVSDASDDRLAQSFQKSTETAKELGSTISDVIGVTADWARLGYNVDEAEELARVTTLFQTVGDNMSSEETSSYLISTLQGFQMATNQAEEIADKYNEVANNFAIDTKGIGEALQRSAASFNAANTDLSEAIALVTTTNTVVQDPSSVGTLWKTMSARVRGAKAELEELGEEEDTIIESTSKLRDLVKGMTGFDIMEDEDTYKSIYEIILGIGKEWDKLSDIDQAALGEALAGKRNANALFAVLNNIETLEQAYDTALKSQGSAQKEQENYAKSIEFSIGQMKAAAQEFWTTFIESGTAKSAIDLLTKLLNLLTEITKETHGIATLGGAGLIGILGHNPEAIEHIFNALLNDLGLVPKLADDATGKMGKLATTINTTKMVVGNLIASPLTPWLLAIGAAIVVACSAWDKMTTTVAEAQEALDKTSDKIDTLKAEIKELSDLDYRTEDQEKRLQYLEQELDYQERIYEVEKKRLLKEKIGTKFSDSFDKDNYNTRLEFESNSRRGDTVAGLLANIEARNKLIAGKRSQQQDFISFLDANKLKTSATEVDYYTKEIGNLEEAIRGLSDENLSSVDTLRDKVQEFQDIIKDTQEGIDSGLLIGSDKTEAEEVIKKYEVLIAEIQSVINPILKENGLYDFGSVIESTFEKVEFTDLRDKLIDLAKSGELSPELLTAQYGDLVDNLKLAEVDADDLYKYLMRLSGIVDRGNLSDRINKQLRHGYGVGTLSGSEYDKQRLLNYINSLSEEDAQIVAELDIDWSPFDIDEAIKKMQAEIDKSHESPLEVDVEPTIVDSVEGINKRLKPQFDELGELYQSIFYGDKGFSLKDVSNEQLQGIKSAFLDAEDERGNKIGVQYEGATEAVNEFIDVLTNAETKSKSLKEQQVLVQEAVNKLATEYFYAAGGLRELNEETKDAIKQQFKQMGIVNIDEVVDNATKTQEWVDSLLDFDANLKNEYSKISEWGLDEYATQIKEKTIQSAFGNVDMDKRAIITWSNELKETYKNELESWEYDPEIGGIDTVYGMSEQFFAGDKEVEVAFTPILEVGNTAKMLGAQTVREYIQKIFDIASKDGKWDLNEILRLDERGMSSNVYNKQGQKIGEEFVHGIIAGVGDLQEISAIDIGELMHFSGMSGAIELAERDIKDLEAVEADLVAQGKTLADITQSDIDALLAQGAVSEQAASQLRYYLAAKAAVNGTLMDESVNINELYKLAQEAGLAAAELQVLQRIMATLGQARALDASGKAGSGAAASALRQSVQPLIDHYKEEIQNQLKQNLDIDFAPPNVTKAAGGGGKETADAWVESYQKELKELENQRDMGKKFAHAT